jgi:hypothetical protein
MNAYQQANRYLVRSTWGIPPNLDDAITAEAEITQRTGFPPANLEAHRIAKEQLPKSYIGPVQNPLLARIQPDGTAQGVEVVIRALVEDGTGETNVLAMEMGGGTCTPTAALVSLDIDNPPHGGNFHFQILREGEPPFTRSGQFESTVELPPDQKPILDHRLRLTGQQASNLLRDVKTLMAQPTETPPLRSDQEINNELLGEM